eukprot:39743_1
MPKIPTVIIPKYPHTTRFMVSPPIFINQALKILNLQSNDVLLDIGCGDGSVLLAAGMQYGCEKLIGVETDGTLCNIARDKLKQTTVKSIIYEDRFEYWFARHGTIMNDWNNSQTQCIENINTNFHLNEVTKAYLFLDSGGIELVTPLLNKYLQSGVQLISCDFPLPELSEKENSVNTRIELQYKCNIRDNELFEYKVK